jgi:hypothetical protein
MMVKMNKKANWTKIKKNILNKKANNFLKNGPIVCKKNWLKKIIFLKTGYRTKYKLEPASNRDPVPGSNL